MTAKNELEVPIDAEQDEGLLDLEGNRAQLQAALDRESNRLRIPLAIQFTVYDRRGKSCTMILKSTAKIQEAPEGELPAPQEMGFMQSLLRRVNSMVYFVCNSIGSQKNISRQNDTVAWEVKTSLDPDLQSILANADKEIALRGIWFRIAIGSEVEDEAQISFPHGNYSFILR